MLNYIKDNIGTIISVLALALTLVQYICGMIRNRENYTVLVDNIQVSQRGNKSVVLLTMTVLNNSSSNLNITRIYYINGAEEYLCNIKKSWCGERYYPQFPETDLPRTERIFSAEFPISIQPNGANNVLVKFEINNDITETKKNDKITLRILTNKKKKVVKTVCLDDKKDLTYL